MRDLYTQLMILLHGQIHDVLMPIVRILTEWSGVLKWL